MSYGFHSKDGLFFERDTDGNVIVRKAEGTRVTTKTTLDPGTWASVIAFVSANGDNASNFQIAKSFHKGELTGGS